MGEYTEGGEHTEGVGSTLRVEEHTEGDTYSGRPLSSMLGSPGYCEARSGL